VPQRLRAGLTLAVVAGAILLARGRLLHVFDAVRLNEGAHSAIRSALTTIALTAVAVFVIWTLIALLDRRTELTPRTTRLFAVIVGVVVGAVLLATAVALLTANPGPRDRVSSAWRHFKAG